VTILVGQTVYLFPVDRRCERCRLSTFLSVVLLSRKAVACWSHGDVADVLEITSLNQRLTPFWSSLRAKFSGSRDCTFDQSTLSEKECGSAVSNMICFMESNRLVQNSLVMDRTTQTFCHMPCGNTVYGICAHISTQNKFACHKSMFDALRCFHMNA
jgi:hypothetical protein